jgi:proteic killer suppression protein
MILGYRDRRTERFARGEDVAAFRAFERQARKRLRILGSATELRDLRGFPGNRLEALKGRRKGQWSIRINLRWRICFVWNEGGAGPSEVEIVDYHDE